MKRVAIAWLLVMFLCAIASAQTFAGNDKSEENVERPMSDVDHPIEEKTLDVPV